MALGIKSRLKLVELSRELGEEWYVSKDAVDAAENGVASNATYKRINALLDRIQELREEAGPEGAADLEDAEDTGMEVDVSGGMASIHAKVGGDVDIFAKAPVSNIVELKQAVADLMREARAKKEPDPE